MGDPLYQGGQLSASSPIPVHMPCGHFLLDRQETLGMRWDLTQTQAPCSRPKRYTGWQPACQLQVLPLGSF